MIKSTKTTYILDESEFAIVKIAVQYLWHRILKHQKPDDYKKFINPDRVKNLMEELNKSIYEH